MWTKRLRVTLGIVSAMTVAAPVWAVQPGGFIGVDLGASEPTNDNYRAHVKTGATGSPFVGYMFDKYIGLQTNFHFTSQPPDSDGRRGYCAQYPAACRGSSLNDENAWTTTLAWTAGPRLNIPLGDMFDLYGTVQGGGFKGVHGRLNQWAPGFLAGGGLDFNLTEQCALGLFARYNRAYMSPHPTYLVGQDSSEQGPEDIQFVTGGISLKYAFNKPEKPLPPPPPPPPPAPAAAPPMKKKIVLRAVYFDFDKSNIRPDARPVLDEAVQLLKDEGTAAIVSEGHTDSVGSDAYNMRLSNRRADSVKRYLADHGVAASRISTEGFGESKPVATNATADGRQQNRRVELRLK